MLEETHAQLLLAQKMESIGQLAAGVAHEINTPTQFVGDNTRFLKDTFEQLAPALGQGAPAAGDRDRRRRLWRARRGR